MSKNDTENLTNSDHVDKGKILGLRACLVRTRQKFAGSCARLNSDERARVTGLGLLGAAIGLKTIGWWGAAIVGAFFWLVTICYYALTEDQKRRAAEKSAPYQPYATLGMFVRWLPHVIGCIAFAALFSSQMASVDKVFFGSALLLLAVWRDINELATTMSKEDQDDLTWFQILNLEKSLKGETVNWREALENHLAQRSRAAERTSGDGSEIVGILLVQYILWIVAGWLISKVVVVL